MDPYGIAEKLAVVLNLTYVVLAIFQSVLCWLAGLFGAVASLVVFLHARFYAGTALQVFYMALMVYGWYQWRHGGEKGGTLAVSRTPRRWLLGLAAAGLASSAVLGLVLKHGTHDAALPFWDAATTSFSLVAQFMTTRKWLESWLVWIGVDVVYTGMLLSQELGWMTALYVAYLVLAVLGYHEWRRSLREASPRTVP
jgi:nicotinamide mononucleotide transporter